MIRNCRVWFFFLFAFILFLCVQASNAFAANILKSVEGTQLNIYTTSERFVFDVVLLSPAVAATPVGWSVKNYFGVQVSSGNTVVAAGRSAAQVDLGFMNTGHYVVTASVSGESVSGDFAVVIPYEQRKPLADSPFATDTFVSWRLWPWYKEVFNAGGNSWPSDQERDKWLNPYVRAVKLSGVKWIRDRMSWDKVHDDRNNLDYSWYDPFIKAFSGAGIKILDSFFATPGWAFTSQERIDANDANNAPSTGRWVYLLPNDLTAAYEFGRKAGYYYKDDIGMWEVWNEPDYLNHQTGEHEGADKFAAFVKAASIGFRDCQAAKTPLVTVGGLVGRINPYLLYQDNLFDNGIINYIDVYNFHQHQNNVSPAGPYDSFSTDKNDAHLTFKNSLAGAGNMPVWITEAGGAIVSTNTTYSELETYEAQKAQARYLVTSAAKSLSTGVDKHFWFCGLPFFEGDAYWGSFSFRMTPYASYVAQSVMTEALGEAKYRGELTNLPFGAKGYVFKDGSDTVLILWDARSATASSTATLSLGKTSGILTDIMGGKKPAPYSGGTFNLTLGPDPVYLRVSGDIPAGVYTESNYPPKVLAPKTFSKAQKIVLDQSFPIESRKNIKAEGAYSIKPNTQTDVEVTVYNFNDATVTGTVAGSFAKAASETAIVSGPQSVTIPAYSSATLAYTVKINDGVSAKLSFTGNFNGIGQTSPSVVNVKTPFSVDRFGEPDIRFSCGIDNWDQFTASYDAQHRGTWKCVNGKLTHEEELPDNPYAYLKDVTVRDGIVSAKMRITGVKKSDNWVALGVRMDPTKGHAGSGYFVLIGSNSQLAVYKGNPVTLITGNNISITTNITNEDAELTLVMHGEQIDIYVNNVYITRATDNKYDSGSIGVLAWNAKIYYHDFKIWRTLPLIVGEQSGATSSGRTGSAVFPVTTAGIEGGTYPAVLNGAPAGVTGSVTITGNSGTLTVNTTAATPSGAHTLTLTVEGLTSNSFNLEVANKVSLDDVKYYPNPIRPSKGLNYAKMNFSNMPVGTRIKIYTMLGQVVRELKADASGTAVWDGKNNAGEKAASGVYIVYMEDGNGNKKRIKIAVER
ncbi:MAG: T9SS type A sorting domain-containing protein [Endomicrobia bacterium]|nr:T9SS type A sorting domain-containing protein [Endomicrobiia bacterium]